MAQQIINVGSAPNDGNGDTLRNSQIKVNANVTELYNAVDLRLDKVTTNDVEKVYIKNADGTQGMKPVSEFGGGEENVQSDWNQINILADDFIKNKPELFSGDYNDLINTPALVTNHSELNLDDGTNPHRTTKYDVDLSNVDNTSDLGKPISNSTQTALNGKANTIHSHVISDVTGLQTALNSKLDKVTTNDVEKVYIKNADGTQSTKPTSDFGTVKGTGTINRISKFTASGNIGDSQIFDDGTKVGIGTTSPQARLDVRAQGVLATDIVLRVRNSTDTQNFLVVNGAGDVYNNGAGGVNTNTFFGENVGRYATGVYNTAIGTSALYANTTGNSNMAIGVGALLYNTTGSSNAAIGVSALGNNTAGYSNMAIGQSALRDNTTGYSNAAIGVSALQNNTTGFNNAAIGSGAGSLISNGSNNTITNNSIFIGGDTRALADNQTNQIVIGNSAIGLGSNSVVLGNTSITITQLRGQVIMGSFASPPTGIEGAIYYDSTTKKHRGFNGTAWNDLY